MMELYRMSSNTNTPVYTAAYAAAETTFLAGGAPATLAAKLAARTASEAAVPFAAKSLTPRTAAALRAAATSRDPAARLVAQATRAALDAARAATL